MVFLFNLWFENIHIGFIEKLEIIFLFFPYIWLHNINDQILFLRNLELRFIFRKKYDFARSIKIIIYTTKLFLSLITIILSSNCIFDELLKKLNIFKIFIWNP